MGLEISEKSRVEKFFEGINGRGLSQTSIISIIKSVQVNRFIEYLDKYDYELKVVKKSAVIL